MEINITEIRQEKKQHLDDAEILLKKADAAKRDFTRNEERQWDNHIAEAKRLSEVILREPTSIAEKHYPMGQRRTAETPDALYVGDGIRALRPKESLYEYRSQNGGFGLPDGIRDDELSLGRWLRGAVTGDWSNAQAERRAMGIGNDVAGGFLLPGNLSARLIDLARNKTKIVQAGAVTIPMDGFDLALAKLDSDPTAAWKGENAAATDSDMTFGRVVLRARTLVALTKSSVELWEDAKNLDSVVSGALSAALALEIDRAALRGGETAGPVEPTGIRFSTGIQTTDKALGSFAIDDLSTAIESLLNVNADGPFSFIWNSTVAGNLDRQKDGEGRYLFPNDIPPSVREAKKLVSNQIGDTYGGASNETEIYAGQFNQFMLGARTNITIEVSREAGDSSGSAFKNLQVWVRAYARMDVALMKANHFHVIHGLNATAL